MYDNPILFRALLSDVPVHTCLSLSLSVGKLSITHSVMKVIILILDLVVIGVFSWLFHEHAGPHNPIAGEYTGLA
jgi:hypothetical protein